MKAATCSRSRRTNLTVIFDHDVAVVPVSYPEDKCSYTVASAGPGEQIHCHVIPAKTHARNKERRSFILPLKKKKKRNSENLNETGRQTEVESKDFHRLQTMSERENSHLALVLVLQPLMQSV